MGSISRAATGMHYALRAWAHVALRTGDNRPQDAPLAGLLRTMWDGLELFGTTTLSGVDAVVPLACVGERLWRRVGSSSIRNAERRATDAPRNSVQATEMWREPGDYGPSWDVERILGALSSLIDVRASMASVPRAAFPPSGSQDVFALGVEQLWSCETDPFRAEVMLNAWTIDDVAWAAEVVSHACAAAGIVEDVQISVQRLD